MNILNLYLHNLKSIMGNCIQNELKSSKFTTRFQTKFSHDKFTNIFNISSATAPDMIQALEQCEWTDKNNIKELKHLLRLYMDKNGCIEKYIILKYKDKVWQFNTFYNDSIDCYRIITIMN